VIGIKVWKTYRGDSPVPRGVAGGIRTPTAVEGGRRGMGVGGSSHGGGGGCGRGGRGEAAGADAGCVNYGHLFGLIF